MIKIDYNPIERRRQEKLRGATEEQLRRINDSEEDKGSLQIIKRTRREKHDGDVFVCTLNGKVYYYGKILLANIKDNEDDWLNGCHMIFIFKEKTTEKTLDNFKGDYNNLICGPKVITSQFWSSGWFETIGNVPLTEEEKNLDYGFWTGPWGLQSGVGEESKCIRPANTFCKIDNTPMDHIPKYIGYGVAMPLGIYCMVKDETILDPTLLEP